MPARNISRDKIGIKAGLRVSIVIRIRGSQSEGDHDQCADRKKPASLLG